MERLLVLEAAAKADPDGLLAGSLPGCLPPFTW